MKKNQPLKIQLITLIALALIFAIDLFVPLGVSMYPSIVPRIASGLSII